MSVRARRWDGPAGVVLGNAALALAVVASLAFDSGDPLTGIWLGNAVQLAVLLLVERRRWPVFLATFAAVQVAIVAGTGEGLDLALATTAVNAVEVVVAAVVAGRDRDWVDGRSDRVASWMRFAVLVLVVTPALGAALAAPVIALVTGQAMTAAALADTARTWYVTDAMSLSVVVPLILRLRPRQLAQLRHRREATVAGGLIVLVGVSSALVFATDAPLLLFVLPLPLVLLLFRTGFAGLAAGMAVLAPITLLGTRHADGPIGALSPGDPGGALLAAQAFLIAVFTLLVVIAALLDERHRHAAMEAASLDVYRLVAATSGDVIIVVEPDGWMRYASPAVTTVLGGPATAVLGYAWRDVLHPDDRIAIQDILRAGRPDQTLAYTFRLRRADGEWRWLEARARHSVSDGPGGHLIVAVFRDVTESRAREEGLRARTAELATLAHTDALTGLPNRRELVVRRDVAWRDAVRRDRSLALLVVDVDHFKSYNDTYGHLAGDRCLARVAAAVAGATTRPGDLCGRYGGEEFVVLLPDTGPAGAAHVAERVRAAVEALAEPHAEGRGGVVTVSVGVSSARPTAATPGGADALFEAADAALFRAKAAGRNTVAVLPLEGATSPPAVAVPADR